MTMSNPIAPAPPLVKTEFRAMNSDIELFTAGPGALRRLARARRWLQAYEDRFSRFRTLSEVSRLNASAGRPFRASPALYQLVAFALELSRRSDGRFDPTVLPSLDAAGYDRSFELIGPASNRQNRARQRYTWRDVELDPGKHTITMPEGCGIDLGGIGKGWAVDRLARILGEPCLVNGGGDVYAGHGPEAGVPWRIGVAAPYDPDNDAAVLTVEHRGVATSSTLKRRWLQDGLISHHLIDPRTGQPSQSDAVQVTVVAPTTTEADYHAKVALLQGIDAGMDYLNSEPGIEGLMFHRDGRTFTTAGLDQFMEPEPVLLHSATSGNR